MLLLISFWILLSSSVFRFLRLLLPLSMSFTSQIIISYYDRITHEFSTDIKVQGKVGIVCLLVAGRFVLSFLLIAKYEERESNVPSFSFFCESSNSLFSSIDEISVYERDVLQAYVLFK